MNKYLYIFTFFMLVFSASSFAGTTTDYTNPVNVASAMQEMGYQAILTADEKNTFIKSGDSGNTFILFFIGCKKNKDCESLQFNSSWNNSIHMNLEQINKWNSTMRYSKAYLSDSGIINLEMDSNLQEGPVSNDRFKNILNLWKISLSKFVSTF